MPNAFSLAVNAINTIYNIFSKRYISSSISGGISDFVCDFIEDENGLMHLIKIDSFYLDELPDFQKKWKTSVEFPKS